MALRAEIDHGVGIAGEKRADGPPSEVGEEEKRVRRWVLQGVGGAGGAGSCCCWR